MDLILRTGSLHDLRTMSLPHSQVHSMLPYVTALTPRASARLALLQVEHGVNKECRIDVATGSGSSATVRALARTWSAAVTAALTLARRVAVRLWRRDNPRATARVAAERRPLLRRPGRAGTVAVVDRRTIRRCK